MFVECLLTEIIAESAKLINKDWREEFYFFFVVLKTSCMQYFPQ